jgi:hypothetical protein
MNRIDRPSALARYDKDFALWCAEQGAALREGRWAALDRENLAEEIESLGRRDRREIESRLKTLLVHLLKYRYQPRKVKPGWSSTIREQRRQLQKIINESPSLRAYPAEVLNEEYVYARADAADETGLEIGTFPERCPFAISDVLDLDYLPTDRD